jgi:transcriptional regulator with XRE-family HTH domain
MNERVKFVRESLELSQMKFGISLGVSAGAITRIEKGQNKLTDQMVKAICREFNVNEQWLRFGKGDIFKLTLESSIDRFVAEQGLSENTRIVLNAYLELDEKKRQIFYEFALRIAEMSEDALTLDTNVKPKKQTLEELFEARAEERAIELLKQRELEASTPISEALSYAG